MKEQRKVTVYSCDAPGCPVEHIYDDGVDDLPYGFHGQVIEVDQTGGEGGAWYAWYACKPAHIKGAVLAAVQRAYEERH